MSDPENLEADPLPQPDPTPAPVPLPSPTPAPVAPTTPAESDFERLDREASESHAGAKKALLASSLNGAVETKPEQQSKVLALADKLGISSDVVQKNYDAISRSVQLRDVDYNRLLQHHPEVSSWLAIPANASVGHQDIPVLSQLDVAFKKLANPDSDANGIIPDGYMFKADGTIRGPLHIDGREPIIYKSLDALRAKFEREEAQTRTDQFIANAAADQIATHGVGWNPATWLPDSVQAGAESSVASTLAAISRASGNRLGFTGLGGEELAQGSQRIQEGSSVLSPGVTGDIGRIAGGLIGDAPLYLLGGEVAGVADLATSLRAVGAGAKVASEVPRSEYLLDAFKTAAAYSPIAARSGINTGADQGAGYGATDFLLNSVVPGAFGSRFGLAKALVPGREAEAAAGGWLGVSGRVLTHVAAQGGIQATTELANAIHEHATGADPDALKAKSLVPRLARAGAMGSVLGGAFHLPGAIGEQVQRQQIASHAALDHAARLGAMVELTQAAKVAGYSPERYAALMKRLVPDEARITHFQGEDWEGVAKAAGMSPDDFAAQMNVEEQYRLARATGQSMSVPTADLIQKAATLEKPEAITSLLSHARQTPDSTNVTESLKFFKEKPAEIDAMVKALKEDVTERSKAVSEEDPIFKDFLGKAVDAGQDIQVAKDNARLMAAFFNVKAERWNEGAEERGAKKIDPLAEYDRYQLRIQTEHQGATGIEPLDAMLDRIRKGDIPDESVGPIAEFAAGGVTPDAVERAHAEGLIAEATPEALTEALERERDTAAIDPIREALTGLQSHLRSKGIDIAWSNAEIKALLAGSELPAVKSYDQPAYHGTGNPEPYDRFSTEKIGGSGGEGAQAVGWGLYFAGKKDLGQFYRDKLSEGRGFKIDGKKAASTDEHDAASMVHSFGSVDDAVEALQASNGAKKNPEAIGGRIAEIEKLRGKRIEPVYSGRLYHVEIPDDHEFLQWDKPLGDQPENIRLAAARLAQKALGDQTDTGDSVLRAVAKGIDTSVTGESFYRHLSESMATPDEPGDGWTSVRNTINDRLANDEAASKALLAAGIPGIKYLDGSSRARGDGTHNYVIFDDSRIKITKYEQPMRGSISYNAERHFLITLTGKANLSTTLHEAGHFYLEAMGDFAEREGAPRQFKDDYADALKFLGVEKRGDIGVEQHEKWARAIEQYLMEGSAPSPELSPIFQRFALWLGHLYSKLKSLVTLTPEVRRVFDRMLASDKAIQEVHEELSSTAFFPNREASGMNEKEWAAYLKTERTDRERGYANVFRQAMRVLRRENTKVYRREKAGAMEEATKIVNARPVHVAEDLFVHGRGPDGKDLDEKPKLDRDEIEREYGKGTIHKLPRGITEEGGMSLQMAADLTGFKSGEDLWTALANLPDRKADIKAMADGILQARHPELTNEEMLKAAMDAVHANAAHADVLSARTAALAMKAGRRAIPQGQIKGLAEKLVDDTNMQDVNPDMHVRSERKASREAADAMLKPTPDYTAAFLANRRAELSHAMYRASMEAKEVIEKTGELMKTAKRTKTREMLGKAGAEGWKVTEPSGIITPFLDAQSAQEFAKSTGGTAEQGGGYLPAMDQLREFWEDRPQRFSMTYGQVSDFYDTARSIMHRARGSFELIVDNKRMSLEKAVESGIKTENGVPKAIVVRERTLGPMDKAGRALIKFDAFMRKLSFVARQMDGEKDGGWHWENLVRPLNRSGDNEQTRNLANTEAINGLLKEWGKGKIYDKLFIPAIGQRLTMEGRLMVALNVGSTKNLERLMTGEKWTREQVKAITDTLDAKDWALVKGVWDHINSFWPEISAMKTRMDGVPPEKRDSLLIDTPHGAIEGKYFPIVYDPHLSARALDLSLEQKKQALTGTPSSGFTQKTVDSTGLRLLLDWRAVTGHMASVSHYLSHAEAIGELNKLLNNKPLTENMIERFGMESFKVIRDAVQDVARGDLGPQSIVESWTRFLRQRSGMAVMGFNAMSAATQIFGMTQAMERVGAPAYIRAQQRIMQSAMSAESASKFAMDKSEMMRNRFSTQTLESLESHGAGPIGQGANAIRNNAYWLMHKAQWLVDLPTWVAGYENALKDFPNQEAKAVALADQAVLDTQGSGMRKDLSKAQRANEFTKMLMQFGGFFNSTYNLGRNRIGNTDPTDPASIARLAGSFMLLVSLPTVAMSLFKESVKPSSDNDGSVSYWAERLGKEHLGYLLNTMIGGRELSSALSGFGYSGPAGMRGISVLSDLTKQAFQGKADHGLERATVMAAGTLWGMPAVQVQRIIDGVMYDSEHGTADPRPLLFGPPR